MDGGLRAWLRRVSNGGLVASFACTRELWDLMHMGAIYGRGGRQQ